MAVYYNEIDKYCVQWLKNLIDAGHLPAGDVDDRPIQEVKGKDLEWYEQAHFFAGVGGWPYALRLAGWPENRPVWTGSCPCQPFSAAGKRRGTADARHLWPEFNRLIAERTPPTVFGEQVASKDGRLWLSGVRSDLEALGYGVGAADLCAAGVGAPHIRQRLWWVAHRIGAGLEEWSSQSGDVGAERPAVERDCDAGRMADTSGRRLKTCNSLSRRIEASESLFTNSSCLGSKRLVLPHGGHPGDGDLQRSGQHGLKPKDGGAGGGVANSEDSYGRRSIGENDSGRGATEVGGSGDSYRPPGSGFWFPSVLLPCLDGKARRTQPGLFPLAHGVPGRVGRLRAYGNAIVPQVAAEFVRAFMGTEGT